MPNTLPPYPLSLIGLPFHCGVKGGVPGNKMANAPLLLLAGDRLPAALKDHREGVALTMLDKADEVTADENGGDLRTIPAGDQMGRILVQNIHLARAVAGARAAGRLPVVVAGTCSASFGVVGGLGAEEEPIGIIWFDAHGDAATPDTSFSGFIEGMILTTITGKCWPRYRRRIPGFREVPEDNVVCISLHEAYAEGGRADASDSVGTALTPPVLKRLGYENALRNAFALLSGRVRKVYLHIDSDVLDPSVLRANRHAADGGLTDSQVVEGVRIAAEYFEIIAVASASYDPEVDPRGPDVLVPMLAEVARIAAASRRE
ncbi:MAG: arginase family protein [Rhizobiaceae bacterium]|nr:arginase family protein [Rhizobiaceae bacterium]